MTETEWKLLVSAALATLQTQPLDFTNESIATYRGLLFKLDSAVFQGFKLLHKKYDAEWELRPRERVAPQPKIATADDLDF